LPVHGLEVRGSCTCGRAGCQKPGKHPRTEHGLRDATTSQEIIREWWRRWPNSNIGVVTGTRSGLLVLDVDVKHGGDVSLADLGREHGELPLTPEAITGGGGRHIVFRYPGYMEVRNSAGLLSPGLDIRGEGGYIVAPPSAHASGRRYRWGDGHHPDDAELAAPPAWLLALIAARSNGHDPAPVLDGVIPESRRNTTLTSLAGSMRRRGASDSSILAALRGENDRCRPPLGDAELRAIARSVSRYPPAVDHFSTHQDGTPAVGQDQASEPEWEVPLPLDDALRRPLFPVEVLPPWAQQWVRAESTSTQTPVDMAAMFFLAVISAIAGRAMVVELQSDWREPANLYVVVVAPSGERKSAVVAAATEPILEWERIRMRSVQPAHAEAKARREVAERRSRELVDKAATTTIPGETARLTDEAAQEQVKAMQVVVPPLLRLTADDVTLEALTSLLADHGGRMAILSAEGGFFGTLAGRYSKGIPNLDVVLKSHTGEPIRVDRKGRAPEWIERPVLTLGLAVQPDVLQSARAVPELRERGLLPRILYSIPASRVGRRSTESQPVSHAISEDYARHIRQLADHLLGYVDNPRVLRLSEPAAATFAAFRAELEPRLAPGSDLGHIAEWGSKLPGAVTRIAGLLHVAAGDPSDEITPPTVAAAIQLGRDYLIDHAISAFGVMGADPSLSSAQRILDELRRRGWTRFTRRGLFTVLPRTQFPRNPLLEPPLALLEEFGWVRRELPFEHLGPGRPRSPAYAVNPAVHGRLTSGSAQSAQSVSGEHSANSADGRCPVPASEPPRETWGT
jgi:hypothetical protein